MTIEVFIILIIGIFVGFYVQTIVGFAGSLIALPILLFKLPLQDAVCYISIFYMFSSLLLLTKEWRNIDRPIILQLSLSTIIGVVIGILVLTYTKPVFLKTALGIFILVYVAYISFGKQKIKLGKIGTYIFGLLAGFFSGVFSSGGPLHVVCLENSIKDVKTFRATMIGLSAVITVTRIPALAISGILTSNHLKMSLLVLPVFLFAQFLGKRTFASINEIFFRKILTVLLCISGLLLVF